MDLIVKFDRIGRSGTTPETALTVHVPEHFSGSADRVATYLHAHCKRHLVSRWFEVDVDLEQGRVWIEAGRFGQGQVLEAKP